MIRIVNCLLVVESTELLGIKWKYSPTAEQKCTNKKEISEFTATHN